MSHVEQRHRDAARKWLHDARRPWDFGQIGGDGPLASDLARLLADTERAALDRAAHACEERAVLNDAVEGEQDMATDAHTEVTATASGHRAIEARCCAHAIRGLA